MTTHIERAVSEVHVEPEGKSATDDERWQQQDRLHLEIEQQEKIQLRTRAEGFDD